MKFDSVPWAVPLRCASPHRVRAADATASCAGTFKSKLVPYRTLAEAGPLPTFEYEALLVEAVDGFRNKDEILHVDGVSYCVVGTLVSRVKIAKLGRPDCTGLSAFICPS
ncbi:hypothetical protein K437DRAFT_257125 [Tilletiaria anomala UBC 951]|uniref:Uncharacterized protein n=1 Tax=Tilletiaria anomala (strain ATCC 24038 / CBS 436.72 / UBC 951) TaxID=1037660 RepID=A0A066VR87_TILAU|nr:uncharacterized protein K437DRAFT_257125 [Tilletiaria anomala UBC 951]KDN44257.1 hypothetical protein K437DRAFT_257125 [Tilletiaria anomala UBC 951]